jgi:transcriptional regulator with PAS, ATPase and Fis domain
VTDMNDRGNLLGQSPSILALRRDIEAAARTHAKVLILGETGVGKEVVACMTHSRSVRRAQPFVAVNCSGIPETLLESELFGHLRGSFTGAYRDKPGLARLAHSGTLFLDELGEMSLRMQAVLLRFVETGELQPIGAERSLGHSDARVIAATNRDLQAQIAAKSFREDLYYRLNVVQLRVPPLRERGDEDIRMLLRHFLDTCSASHGMERPELTPDAQRILENYEWPGNVRELKNVIERLVVRGLKRAITVDDLPLEVRGIAEPVRSVARERESFAGPLLAFAVRPSVGPTSAAASPIVDEIWHRLMSREDFWTVVHQQFKNHDLTRNDVRGLIQRGLVQTRGSYRGLLELFNLPSSDYKRLLSFLHQHDCHVPFQRYRAADSPAPRQREELLTH